MSVAELEKLLGDKLLKNEPLAKYTAARIGGPADYLYVADDALIFSDAVKEAWVIGLPIQVLGGGANVLVSDRGMRGLVVINRLKHLSFFDESYNPGDKTGAYARVDAGIMMTTLARETTNRGLTGFEWAVSVPGTVGGGIVNNAGAHGTDMSDSVCEVDLMDVTRPQALHLSNEQLGFRYRGSILKDGGRDSRFVVMNAVMRFERDDPDAIRARMDEYRAHRKRTQPPGASLGSIFKNPDGDYAGRLIEEAGLKGYTIGGAAVSEKHANFFINSGGATATDYRALVEHVQEEVARQFNVDLETEIEMIGEWD